MAKIPETCLRCGQPIRFHGHADDVEGTAAMLNSQHRDSATLQFAIGYAVGELMIYAALLRGICQLCSCRKHLVDRHALAAKAVVQ
jgi:hypothetical protein